MNAAGRPSLLWPEGAEDGTPRSRWPPSAAADVGLGRVVEALAVHRRHKAAVAPLLHELCQDPRVIVYRQEVLEDLLDRPGLTDGLEAMLPALADVADLKDLQGREATPLQRVVWRLGELHAYLECVRGLRAVLEKAAPRSLALRTLGERLAVVERDEGLRALAAELPALKSRADDIASVTLGLNLDGRLQFASATLLSINDRKFRGSTLLGRLTGRGDGFQGVGPLHVGGDPQEGGVLGLPTSLAALHEQPQARALMEDLNRLLGPVFGPISVALGRYARVTADLVARLGPEIAFYAGIAGLVNRVRAAGLPMCRPEVAGVEERTCRVEGVYDLSLALRLLGEAPDADLGKRIVANGVDFGPEGRILILTGPNGGGKTTYTQAVGLAQALFQAGGYVPGRAARISPVDAVYTHFPVEERPGLDAGRLGEEAARLGEIFRRATRHSLVLLNESLASTSPGESLHMARDIVRGLRLLGARALYNTHLHDLAAGVGAINADTPGDSEVVSLVAGAERLASGEGDAGPEGPVRRTYEIRPGPPIGLSYAREVAARHGISYEKIAQSLAERGG